eukprot:GFUD01007955.1.p1 GENE.GFUD01007955.1~~GFUD01007955.1.p1  ORF type:complete len:1043 (+),score=306.14 GFUD01007955.1:186-3314(+)
MADDGRKPGRGRGKPAVGPGGDDEDSDLSSEFSSSPGSREVSPEREDSGSPVGARGVSVGIRDVASIGRGRVARGRGLGLAATLSSSSSTLSLSSERGDIDQLDEAMLQATLACPAGNLFLPPDLGPPPFNPDTDFPMARAGALPSGGLTPEFYPPQSRLSGKFPGTKSTGRACKLQTNHFPLSLKFPQGMIYQYSVTIMPPWFGRRDYKRTDKQLYHDTIKEWKEVCPAAKHNTAAWVFDGHKQLFCTQAYRIEELPDQKVSVWCQEEERFLEMMIKDVERVSDIKVTQDIMEWAGSGRSGHVPQDALQALDVVLKEAINLDLNFYTIGRSHFPMDGETLDVGFGKEVWIGTFSAVRPYGWKDHEILITLNVDTANKPATRNLHLTNESAPGKSDSYIHSVLAGDGRRKAMVNFARGFTDEQVKTMEKDLKDLKVKYVLPSKDDKVIKRQYRVNGFRKSATKEIIPDLKISVAEYFKETHGVDLKYPNLPCLWVGPKQKTIYIPMEFCKMDKQPMPRKKKLPDDAVAKMIRATAVKPMDRQKKIIDGLKKNNAMYKDDPYAREFGISVSGEMAKLTGRVLDAPVIEYSGGKVANINKSNPGKWFQDKNQYVVGQTCTNWCLFDLSGLSENQFKEVVMGFSNVGKEVGMNISKKREDILRISGTMREAEDVAGCIEEKLKQALKHFESENKKLEMILIIFPFKAGFLYDKIKQLGDIKYNITTQCCLKTVLFKGDSLNKQVVGNICLKINAKLGGINHVLAPKSKPAVLKRPVMVMGADVSHPAPESRGLKPSIAAIVASVEPKAANYEVEIRIQDGGQNEEVIQDMKNVTKNLLIKFHAANKGRKPEKILMFRDGVSEGQFLTVLARELLAMREACKELEEGYEPQITYIVVQKRHHTRFFPTDGNKYKNGNALAGTVVDQGINHPTEGDFYLLSHEGIQGTSRPCHYQVLWDDSDFSADELEVLSYYLCHLYSRCTRAVSYPTPTYYSHLVADRARKHHNELASFDGGSTSGGSMELTDNQKRDIKKVVEEGVKKAMYFV